MENMIKSLQIKNFKSIKDLNLNCKRINIFVGKPNTGKSNILEALSLFSIPYDYIGHKILQNCIRYEQFDNLFYDNEPSQAIEVITDFGSTFINWENNYYLFFSSTGFMNIQDYKNAKDKGNYLRGLNASNIEY